MNKQQLAKALRKNPKIIGDWVTAGMPYEQGENGRYEFNLAEVWAWREEYVRDNTTKSKPAMPPTNGEDTLLDGYVDRINNWRKVCSQDTPLFSIEDVAELIGLTVDDVLHYVRMGAPYRECGDFKTGKGFTLQFAHFIDWYLLLQRVIYAPYTTKLKIKDLWS